MGGAKRKTVDERVDEFRALVYSGIRKADALGKTLKPYDGTVSLQWPPLVHTHVRDKTFSLRLSFSAIGGPSSHYSWRNRSWATVFRHATEDVTAWIADMDDAADDGGDDVDE